MCYVFSWISFTCLHFFHICSFQLKQDKSTFYLINGAVFIITWIVFRVLIVPYLYLMFAYYKGIPFYSVPFSIPIKCNIGSIFIAAMQVTGTPHFIRICLHKYMWNWCLDEFKSNNHRMHQRMRVAYFCEAKTGTYLKYEKWRHCEKCKTETKSGLMFWIVWMV